MNMCRHGAGADTVPALWRRTQEIQAVGRTVVRRRGRRTGEGSQSTAAPCAHFSCVPSWAGMIYEAFVFDVFSGRILGRRAATAMTTDLVLNPSTWRCGPALKMASTTCADQVEQIHHTTEPSSSRPAGHQTDSPDSPGCCAASRSSLCEASLTCVPAATERRKRLVSTDDYEFLVQLMQLGQSAGLQVLPSSPHHRAERLEPPGHHRGGQARAS